jgi:hypothetical protein
MECYVGQFNPVWQHHPFLRKINTVLIRLKFSSAPDTQECCIYGSEKGVSDKKNSLRQLVLPPHNDVRRILEKLPKERRRPRGWYKTHISITLGTPDRAAAKRKCCDVGKDGSIVFPHHGGKDTRCPARMPVFPNSHPFAHSTFTQDVTSGSRLSLFSAR